jgi:hypothetical protein
MLKKDWIAKAKKLGLKVNDKMTIKEIQALIDKKEKTPAKKPKASKPKKSTKKTEKPKEKPAEKKDEKVEEPKPIKNVHNMSRRARRRLRQQQ